MKNAKLNKKKEKEWFFNIIEEALLNESFNKKHPNYVGGRIEIWNRNQPYDIAEIRLLLPREIFDKIRDALDFKEVDFFQIGEVRSDDLSNFIKDKNKTIKTKSKGMISG